MKQWYLGTIGFSYKDWLGAFYPAGTNQRTYLLYYSKVFNCVELDSSFHSIPPQVNVTSWFNSTPSDFRFCFKTPRHITHELKLLGAEAAMDEFLTSIQFMQEKLGPILIQLPPKFKQDKIAIVDNFLTRLPQNYRYAVEFRHPSWYNAKTSQMLSTHKVCWVSNDFPTLPRQINLTTDFLFHRWIGVNGIYQHHSYERVDKNEQLKWWLDLILSYSTKVQHLYGFFNNDYTGFAAGTCIRFMQIAGLIEENDLPYQERLF
jgi:uncharacterized protein YecE (DUF72 family)